MNSEDIKRYMLSLQKETFVEYIERCAKEKGIELPGVLVELDKVQKEYVLRTFLKKLHHSIFTIEKTITGVNADSVKKRFAEDREELEEIIESIQKYVDGLE